MSIEAKITCSECDFTTSATLPDNMPIPYLYNSGREEIQSTLTKKLQKHHEDTGIITPPDYKKHNGHRDFHASLTNKGWGTLEATAYAVTYKRLS